jgi:myo-inositol-1(or 4)-monophosphatase
MINELKAIVKEASVIFVEGFYAEKRIEFKGKVDLVTQYDVMVEEFLIPRLQRLFPNLPIIGEESFGGGVYPASGVFVDPIDGTTNFAHGLPFCAISIGVWEDGKPRIGVVYNPIMDEMFWASEGHGAYCNGERIEVSTCSIMHHALVSTGFPYTKSDGGADFEWTMARLANILPHTRDVRRFGSASLDICYVAKGVYDCFYELNLKAWDTAGAAVILREAGGITTNEYCDEYSLNDRCIVATNGVLHKEFLELLACSR